MTIINIIIIINEITVSSMNSFVDGKGFVKSIMAQLARIGFLTKNKKIKNKKRNVQNYF